MSFRAQREVESRNLVVVAIPLSRRAPPYSSAPLPRRGGLRTALLPPTSSPPCPRLSFRAQRGGVEESRCRSKPPLPPSAPLIPAPHSPVGAGSRTALSLSCHPRPLLPCPRVCGDPSSRHARGEPAPVKTDAGTHPHPFPCPRVCGDPSPRHAREEPAPVKTGTGTHRPPPA